MKRLRPPSLLSQLIGRAVGALVFIIMLPVLAVGYLTLLGHLWPAVYVVILLAILIRVCRRLRSARHGWPTD